MVIVVDGVLQYPGALAVMVYVPGVVKVQLKLLPDGVHPVTGVQVVPVPVDVKVTGWFTQVSVGPLIWNCG